jgi:hemoglobin
MKKNLIAFALAASSLLMAGTSFAQTAPQNDQLYKASAKKPGWSR